MRTTASSSLYTFILKLILLTILIHVSEQTSTANPLFNVTLFDPAASFRQNVCDRQNKFNSGEVSLKKSLEGLSIRAVLGKGDYLNIKDDGYTIDDSNPGVVVEILDEVARRGNFTWRDSFTIAPYLDTIATAKSWTDFLVWETDAYDITIDWWMHSAERVALGVTFPTGWYDASIIIVGAIEEHKNVKFNPISWMKPFSTGVWLMLVATLLISSIFYLYFHTIDNIDNEEKEKEKRQSTDKCQDDGVELPDLKESAVYSLVNTWRKEIVERKDSVSTSIYQSSMVFTGHLDLKTNSLRTQFITFSLSFFAMLMVSAYTANLATNLVVTNIPPSNINKIEDIVSQGLKMCTMGGSASEEVVRQAHPGAFLVRKSTNKDIIDGLNNGECDYAMTTVAYWEEAQVTRQNFNCNLTQVGRMVEVFDAGFSTKSDAGTLCTSLIRDVFDAHLREMKDDNFLEEKWNKHLRNKREVVCTDRNKGGFEEISNDTQRLGLRNVGSIFLLHGCVLVLALISWKVKKREKVALRIEGVQDKSDHNSTLTISSKISDLANQILEIKQEMKSIKEQLDIVPEDRKTYDDDALVDKSTNLILNL